jgi:D-psicose/D-tagatose/L-ribulose 3-epimerase
MPTLMAALFLALATLPPPVKHHPVGRCVRVLGVTAPEDARTAGFEYLELALQDLLPLPDAEFAAVVTRMKAVGLPALSGYGFLPADSKVVGPGADPADIDRQLKHGLGRARRLGLGMVVFGNLNGKTRQVPEGFDRQRAEAQFLDFARRAAALGAQHGITVLIEPMPARASNLINTVAEGLALVRRVNHPRLQLLVDYGYLVESKEDLEILHTAAPHIRQIEIQNPSGRVYPRQADESDYAAFFQALRRGGYRGGFSVHGKPTVFFEDAPRAITLLRTLAAQHLAATGPNVRK